LAGLPEELRQPGRCNDKEDDEMGTTNYSWPTAAGFQSDPFNNPVQGNVMGGIEQLFANGQDGKYGAINAYSPEQMEGLYAQGQRNLRTTDQQSKLALAQQAGARGVSGPDLGSMMRQQIQAKNRGALAQGSLAAQTQGMEQGISMLGALGDLYKSGVSQQQFQQEAARQAYERAAANYNNLVMQYAIQSSSTGGQGKEGERVKEALQQYINQARTEMDDAATVLWGLGLKTQTGQFSEDDLRGMNDSLADSSSLAFQLAQLQKGSTAQQNAAQAYEELARFVAGVGSNISENEQAQLDYLKKQVAESDELLKLLVDSGQAGEINQDLLDEYRRAKQKMDDELDTKTKKSEKKKSD
jgi:hypothetical protein